VIKGFPAWLMHRGYHVLAVPTWERKIRVLTIWLTAALFGRDIVSLASVQHPREAFIRGGEPALPPSDAPADVTRDRGWAVLAGSERTMVPVSGSGSSAPRLSAP
jgi:hypothetical protein